MKSPKIGLLLYFVCLCRKLTLRKNFVIQNTIAFTHANFLERKFLHYFFTIYSHGYGWLDIQVTLATINIKLCVINHTCS